MTDRPIIMSAPMVRALLAGRKMQTRRIMKLPTASHGHAIYERRGMGGWEPTINGGGGCFSIGRDGSRIPAPETVGIWHRTCGVCLDAPYQAGDRLWVRENWAAWMHAPAISVETMAGQLSRSEIAYKATDDGWNDLIADRNALREFASKTEDGHIGNWVVRSPIHMPRWASRLTLDVTDVRVQQLQDISEEDAIAEGVHVQRLAEWAAQGVYVGAGKRPILMSVDDPSVTYEAFPGADCSWNRSSQAFADLWCRIHGGAAWAENPWVAALTFTVHHGNIDALPARPLDGVTHDGFPEVRHG